MTDPVALVHANRRRLRVRRIVLLASTPLLLAALLFCAKVLSMYAFAHQAVASHATGHHAGTVEAARGQEPFNVFEPWKAPYNAGVGLAELGDLDGARARFEEALALARGLEQCAVRVNLAIVLERIGDRALREGDGAAASKAWQEALTVTEDAPAECSSPEADDASPDPDRSMEETLEEQERRLSEKLEDNASPDQPEEPEQGEEQDTPDGDKLDDIKDRLEQGQQERDERDESNEGDGGGSGTDRPW
ncbi:hypothetical protein H4J02_11055 [Protaetiibacter sp. SSC-01]|uniref:hypothetical protein n=1 Tax=Protaetiibacter sp. SSC-01 TaxID=2759943 RepID=UPI0016569257|nr:hypothetical protein [Protaetiibacter sp. SSC-01]QNO36994.1 hypothetical protein H4J02_11055 [Protaetiibacter sp. SSC-01]